MITKICTFVCFSTLVTGLAAQEATRTRRPVDISTAGLDAVVLHPSLCLGAGDHSFHSSWAIVGLAYSLGAMVAAFELTVFVMRSGQFSPTLNIPAYFLYLAPVVGFASLAFRFLLRLLSIRDARRQAVETDWLGDAEA